MKFDVAKDAQPIKDPDYILSFDSPDWLFEMYRSQMQVSVFDDVTNGGREGSKE